MRFPEQNSIMSAGRAGPGGACSQNERKIRTYSTPRFKSVDSKQKGKRTEQNSSPFKEMSARVRISWTTPSFDPPPGFKEKKRGKNCIPLTNGN